MTNLSYHLNYAAGDPNIIYQAVLLRLVKDAIQIKLDTTEQTVQVNERRVPFPFPYALKCVF